MIVKKILWTLVCLTISGAVFLWAGDTAVFVDLGFSPDGKTYAFAQYGVQSNTLKPWSELNLVDVASNNFVSGGRLSFVHDISVAAGQDGSGAFYRILTQNKTLTDRYSINFLTQGQPLFISLDEPDAPPGQAAEFRDFETGASYRATLIPTIQGSGPGLVSSFYISLEQTGRDGVKKTLTAGSPQIKRSQIDSYRIRKVLKAPGDGSLIFVIEMKKQNSTDYDIRFMVEALRL
ncbi:MAG: DUF2259 domain-containing protein [Treponema sp.]|nr:DUF2259 domain-containing protein [Treponema sp.]